MEQNDRESGLETPRLFLTLTLSTQTKLLNPIPTSPYGFQITVSSQPAWFKILSCKTNVRELRWINIARFDQIRFRTALPVPASFRTGSLTPLYTLSYASVMVMVLLSSVCISPSSPTTLLRNSFPSKDPTISRFSREEVVK